MRLSAPSFIRRYHRLALKIDRRPGFAAWEAASLSALIDAHLRAPRPLAIVPTAAGTALVYEWIDADPACVLTAAVADDARRVLAALPVVRGRFPRSDVLTLRELAVCTRPRDERERLARMLLHELDGFDRHYRTAHGDLWTGNLIVSASGDVAFLDPKLQSGPRCVDLVSYCFHAPAALVPDAMLDDLAAAGRDARVAGVIRELARCPDVPAEPWLEWALRGGIPPATHEAHVTAAAAR